MCEIAVFDPSRTDIEVAQQIAYTFYEEQGDGLGILAAEDTGERYEYETYKSTEPHWQTVYAFFNRVWDDAWRIVIHGRAGTSGGRNRNSAHPIHVDCSHCDWDYVIHNGSVRNYKRDRRELKEAGHEFTGGVDTEVIPHTVRTMPEDVSNLTYSSYSINGNLNYLLFSEQGIFVRAQRKYDLTDDFRMTCRLGEVEDVGFDEGENRWLMARPGEEISVAESNVRTHNATSRTVSAGGGSRSGSRNRQYGNRNSGAATWPSANGTRTSGTDSRSTNSDTVTITYEDHCSSFDDVSVIKVAPGVMRIHDSTKGEVHYAKRNIEPRLYFFYAPEEAPDDQVLEELERHASAEEDGGQQTFDDIVDAEAVDATNRAVEEVADVGEAVARIVDGD